MRGEGVTMRKAARGATAEVLVNSAAILRQVPRPPSVIGTTQPPPRGVFQAFTHQLPRQDREDHQGQQTTGAAKAGAIWTTTLPDRGLPPPPCCSTATPAPRLHDDLQNLWFSGWRDRSAICQVPSTPCCTPRPAVLLICQGSSTQSPQQHVPLSVPMAIVTCRVES